MPTTRYLTSTACDKCPPITVPNKGLVGVGNDPIFTESAIATNKHQDVIN